MTKSIATAPGLVFSLFRRLQHFAAHAQGMGYGVANIRQEVELVRRVLPQSPRLAIDIGGNIGDYTAQLRGLSSELEIHTFEPAAVNIERLRTRFADDKKVTLVPLAASDKTGVATLFANQPGSGLGSLTLRRLEHLEIPFEHTETIDTVRFEEYWQATLQRRSIDILKIDTEGHELAVLAGLGEALRFIHAIQFEFGGCNIDTRTYFQDFWYFFRERGFSLFRITPFGLQRIERYRESDESFLTTNYIAVASTD